MTTKNSYRPRTSGATATRHATAARPAAEQCSPIPNAEITAMVRKIGPSVPVEAVIGRRGLILCCWAVIVLPTSSVRACPYLLPVRGLFSARRMRTIEFTDTSIYLCAIPIMKGDLNVHKPNPFTSDDARSVTVVPHPAVVMTRPGSGRALPADAGRGAACRRRRCRRKHDVFMPSRPFSAGDSRCLHDDRSSKHQANYGRHGSCSSRGAGWRRRRSASRCSEYRAARCLRCGLPMISRAQRHEGASRSVNEF